MTKIDGRIRKSHNLTQAELAEELGVDRSAIAKWESGASLPRPRLLLKMAKIFQCKVDDLLCSYGE